MTQQDPRRRKQARHAKRNKARRRNRGMLLRVLLIAAILAAAAGGVYLFLSRGDAPSTEPVETGAEPVQTQPVQTEPEEPKTGTTVIHVAAAGDLNVTDYVLESAKLIDALYASAEKKQEVQL